MQVMRGAKRKGVRYFGPYAPRLGDPRDRRPAAAGLPGPHLLAPGCSSAPARSAGPACSATSASARRPASAGSRAEEHRELAEEFCDFMAGRTGRFIRRLEQRDARRRRRAGVRAGRPAARRHRGAAAGHGEAGGRARRRHRRRRDRVRRGRARGRRPGLPRPRRPGPRPARLGRRQGRGASPPATWSSTSCRSSTARSERATACPSEVLVPGAARRRRGGRRAAGSASSAARRVDLRVPQRGDKKALMETVERNAEQALAPAQDQARRRPDHPLQGAGGDRRTRSTWTRRRCASSATTSPTSRATDVVASMVVFEDGLARKSEYRRFVIRTSTDRTTSPPCTR